MPVVQHPGAFFLLLAVPALYVLRRLGLLKKPSFSVTMADWNGMPFVWARPLERFVHLFSGVLFVCGYICVVIAMADPVIVRQEKVYTSRGTEILFVLDTSPSMAAKDVAEMSRLEAAKIAVRQMLPDSGGTAFGLVAMGSEAALIVPPTIDKDLFVSQLDTLYVGMLGDGTAIGEGVSTAVYHLAASSAPKKCVVVVTDGENNAGKIHPQTGARLAKDHGVVLYTLGIGTHGSVPIEYVDPVSGKVYSGYLDSQFDSASLEELADYAGGRYFGVETSGALYSALSMISNSEQTVQTFYLKTLEESHYDIFLGVAALMFVAAWLLRRLYIGEQI